MEPNLESEDSFKFPDMGGWFQGKYEESGHLMTKNERKLVKKFKLPRGTFTETPTKIKRKAVNFDGDESENECSVCRDGGNLLCCHTCPRVFHKSCHVPCIKTEPVDDWICGLCQDVKAIRDHSSGRKKDRGLSQKDLKICERILLEMLCFKLSHPFHYAITKKLSPEYCKTFQNLHGLNGIRDKLCPNNIQFYDKTEEFADDISIMLKNCVQYSEVGSDLHNAAKEVDDFFQNLLQEYYPNKYVQID